MSDAPELLPCPFCGSDDIQYWGKSTWSRPVKWVYCADCQAQGPRVMLGRDEGEEAWEERTRAEWNGRIPAALAENARLREELATARDRALDEAASVAEIHLDDWANDLAATRDDLISAQTTGIWAGRKVRDKSWLKKEAARFGERAEAVAESANHTAAAIRALKGAKP